jgi:hypothetical protein
VTAFVILASTLAGLTFYGSLSNPTVESWTSTQLFNLSVNNSGPGNLVQINVSIPEGLSYMTGTAGTSSSDCNLSYYSSSLLTWDNLTSSGFVDTSGIYYFWFNASVSGLAHGTKYVNVSAANTTYDTNHTSAFFNVLVPIATSGNGNFSSEIEQYATSYQSFYFYANSTPSSPLRFVNATSVSIGITSTGDVDAFLIDPDGTLRAKSTNGTGGIANMLYSHLSDGDGLWEVRVYSNSSSAGVINGTIAETGLNVTNASLSPIGSIAFGTHNVTSQSSSLFVISNSAGMSLPGVGESGGMYIVRRIHGTSSGNYSIFVPNSTIVPSISAYLNWTGGTDYALMLYGPDGSLLSESRGKHAGANISGVEQEEYLDYANVAASAKVFTIGVGNVSGPDAQYGLLVRMPYMSPGDWMSTNFTSYNGSSLSFSQRGQENSSYPFALNLSVPPYAMNGTYEGYLRYADPDGAGIEIPLYVDVVSPVLAINGTAGNASYSIDINQSVSSSFIYDLNISNLGDLPMQLTYSDSGSLVGTMSGNVNVSMSYNKPLSIAAGSSDTMRVNITYDQSYPRANYTGWIFLNATNSTSALSARPYQTYMFNFSIGKPWMTMATNATNSSAACSFVSQGCNISVSMANVTTWRYYVNLTNNGPVAADSSSAPSISSGCSGFTVSSAYFLGCPSSGSGPSYFSLGAQNQSCLAYWDITSNNAAASACTISVAGGTGNQWADGQTVTITVTKVSSTTTTTISTNDAGAGAGGAAPAEPTASLSITKSDPIISIKPNASNTSVVVVKNTGDRLQNISFSLTGIESAWYRINASKAAYVSSGQSAAFMVTFLADYAEVKDYQGQFVADGTSADATANFILRVMPDARQQQQIQSDLPLIVENFTRVYELINRTKSEGKIDTTAAEGDILAAQEKIRQAEEYMANGDYFNAYQLYSEIRSLVSAAEDKLSGPGQMADAQSILSGISPWITNLIIAAFAAVLVAGAAYMYVKKAGPFAGTSPKAPMSWNLGRIVSQASERMKDTFGNALDSIRPGVRQKRDYRIQKIVKEELLGETPSHVRKDFRPVGRFTIENPSSGNGIKGALTKVIDSIKNKIGR